MRTCADLDSYDTRILQQLSADGRTTWRDLAEIIGLSLTPTIRRVRQLEEDGFITGYFARLDERLLSGGMSVFVRSEEHTSELQSLMRISYAVFCLKKKKNNTHTHTTHTKKTITNKINN